MMNRNSPAATIGALALGLMGTSVMATSVAVPTGKELAAAKHCDVCHDAQTPKVGPSFRDVARRYGNLANGKTLVARIVRAGSDTPSAVYHWGSSTMPPDTVRVPVSEKEADTLADYVLSFK